MFPNELISELKTMLFAAWHGHVLPDGRFLPSKSPQEVADALRESRSDLMKSLLGEGFEQTDARTLEIWDALIERLEMPDAEGQEISNELQYLGQNFESRKIGDRPITAQDFLDARDRWLGVSAAA